MEMNILRPSETRWKETGKEASGRYHIICSGETKQELGLFLDEKKKGKSVEGYWPGQFLAESEALGTICFNSMR